MKDARGGATSAWPTTGGERTPGGHKPRRARAGAFRAHWVLRLGFLGGAKLRSRGFSRPGGFACRSLGCAPSVRPRLCALPIAVRLRAYVGTVGFPAGRLGVSGLPRTGRSLRGPSTRARVSSTAREQKAPRGVRLSRMYPKLCRANPTSVTGCFRVVGQPAALTLRKGSGRSKPPGG